MDEVKELYQKHKDDIYHYLLGVTQDAYLSEDLTSETFLRAMSALAGFKGDSTVKTWLFGIARNVWLQYINKKRPLLSYDDLLQSYIRGSIEKSRESGMEEYIYKKQVLDRAIELIKAKGGRESAVVFLRMAGWSYAEVATRLSLSENSARVIDFRTKQWLKAKLREEGLLC